MGAPHNFGDTHRHEAMGVEPEPPVPAVYIRPGLLKFLSVADGDVYYAQTALFQCADNIGQPDAVLQLVARDPVAIWNRGI